MSLQLVSSFPARLKEALGEITLSDFAKRVNVSRQTISAYTTGARKPKKPMLKTLAEALDVNEDWLLGYNTGKERNNHFIPIKEDIASYLTSSACDNNFKMDILNSLVSSSQDALLELIEQKHGRSAKETFFMYLQLDAEDRGEIRGEIKYMLKSEKYSTQEGLKHA